MLTWTCPTDGPLLSRMFAWRCVAFVNRTRRIDPKTLVPFRKFDKDSGGSVSWNTQPNCRHYSHLHFCHHPSSVFCWVKPSTCLCATSTYHRFFNPMQIYRIDSREDANNHKVIWCKYLSRSLCTAVDWTSRTPGSEVLFASTHFYLPFCVGGSEDGAVFGVDFARSSSCRKLRWSPLEHCPCFQQIENSLSPSNATQSPATRNHCGCLNSLTSGIKIP